MFKKLAEYIATLQTEDATISPERRLQLRTLAAYVQQRRQADQPVHLNFICTHNSRRSHISQLWAATAAAYFDIDVHTYSGGTEATAFHPNAVAAMERAGFRIDRPAGANPHYRVHYAEAAPPLLAFSKVYDAATNPARDFAAIMTCTHADTNCPYIPGADWRLSLPYDDPKLADGTPAETARYDERVRQIGRELVYAFAQIDKHATLSG